MSCLIPKPRKNRPLPPMMAAARRSPSAAAVKQVAAGIPQVSAPASFGAETLATVLRITDEKV